MELIYMLNEIDCQKCKYFIICESIKNENNNTSYFDFIKMNCYFYVNQDNNYPRKEV